MNYKDQIVYEIDYAGNTTNSYYNMFIVRDLNFKTISTKLFHEATTKILKDYFDSNKINKSVGKYMVDFYQMIYDDRRSLPYKICGITIREFLHRIDIENERNNDENKNTD